jgi:hypothetical protein
VTLLQDTPVVQYSQVIKTVAANPVVFNGLARLSIIRGECGITSGIQGMKVYW